MAFARRNARVLDRAQRSSRGLQFAALAADFKPIEHLFKTSAPAVAGTPGAVGAVMIRPPAFAVSLDEADASHVLDRHGAAARGVRSTDGESAFVFCGPLPGMALPDGRAWEAIGSDLLGRLGDPRADALPRLPDRLRQWLAGVDWPADEGVPNLTAEPRPSCGSCRICDPPSSECRDGPLGFVVGAVGVSAGWLFTRPEDVCPSFAPRDGPSPTCLGRRSLRDLPGHDGRRGLCRGAPPLQPLNNTGRPTGRTGSWPPSPQRRGAARTSRPPRAARRSRYDHVSPGRPPRPRRRGLAPLRLRKRKVGGKTPSEYRVSVFHPPLPR